MPETHHADWCPTKLPVASGNPFRVDSEAQRARVFLWTFGLFFATCGLAWWGMSRDPWVAEGGGHPLLLLGLPFLTGALFASKVGAPPVIAGILGVSFQVVACFFLAKLVSRIWPAQEDA